MSSACSMMVRNTQAGVNRMQPQSPRPGTDATGELTHPPYWLVFALPWPGGDLAEGAIAVAPSMIPRDGLSGDAWQILANADVYAKARKSRVIFFSDLTRALARGGTSWAALGIDWEHGLREIEDGRFPALILTVTERAYAFICIPAVSVHLCGVTDDTAETGGYERDLVRDAITRQLTADWPQFMRRVIDAAQLRPAAD
jgi:hypothetical protein